MTNKLTITKEFKFNSSHRLHDSNLNTEQNQRLFGKCNNSPSHGHTYKLFVTISGPIKNGMIINFTDLKKLVKETILDEYDYHFLNNCITLKGKITTCEVMVDIIFDILGVALKMYDEDIILEEIKLYETETSFATYKR